MRRVAGLPEVAVRVGDALRRHEIRAVLTGGACASLHSGGRVWSMDVDFVLAGNPARGKLDRAMASIGFAPHRDRYIHPDLPFFVEFPAGPLTIGADLDVKPIEHRLGARRALVLSPTDTCRDRLAAFYHWRDEQSLRSAVLVALRNRIRMEIVRRWSANEGHAEGFQRFAADVRRGRATQRSSG